jgi:uncharacterized membrane protein (DUF485 family)
LAKFLNVDGVIDSALDYLKVKAEILKLDILERLSGLAALLISFLVVFIVFMFFIAFLSLTVGNALNEALDSSYWGYAMITFLYFLFLLITIYVLKSGIMKRAIESAVAKSMKTSDKDEENE